MKKVGIIYFLLKIHFVFAQKTDTTYINTNRLFDNVVKRKSEATIYIISTETEKTRFDKIYEVNGTLKVSLLSIKSSDTAKGRGAAWLLTGKSFVWRKKNVIQKEYNFLYGLRHGEFKEYYPSGKLMKLDIYNLDTLLSSYFYNEYGEKSLIYEKGVQPARLPKVRATLPYLQDYFFPKNRDFIIKPVETYVKFVVNKEGMVRDMRVLYAYNKKMEREAVKQILKLPKFIPAQKDNEPIETTLFIPIRFGETDWIGFMNRFYKA